MSGVELIPSSSPGHCYILWETVVEMEQAQGTALHLVDRECWSLSQST